MHPILIKAGPLVVYSYGVMVAIGFAIAVFCIYRRAPKFSLKSDKMVDLTILILLAGIFGARALYILLNLPYYQANPAEIIMLSKGGLVWYGGFTTAVAALVIYLWLNKMNFWNVVDLMAPYVALAQAFGRIGCFLNGCCYGMAVDHHFPLAVTLPCDETARLPSQLMSALALFLIFIILRIWQNRRRFLGEIFLGYCVLYPSKRFLMEFLRGDNPKIFLGLTISQLVSVAIFAVALILFIYKADLWKKRTSDLK